MLQVKPRKWFASLSLINCLPVSMPKHERCVSSSPKQHWPLLVSMLLQRRRTRGKAENARRFPRQLAAAFSMSSPLTNQTVAPLCYAPVGMTNGRVAFPFRFDIADEEQQVPPLHFAPVGMTLLFGYSDCG